MKEDKLQGTRSPHGKIRNVYKNLTSKSKKKNHLGDTVTGGTIILKEILEKGNAKE
jgi:hypothetical protein